MTQVETASRRRVLVTGAAGRIGSHFAAHAHCAYQLRLMVRAADGDGAGATLEPYGEVVRGDLGDLERLKELCQGIDTVVHLAATSSASATWRPLLRDNIIGTYNLFVAAKAAGCRRVIFASSIHAVSGYPSDVQVKPSEAVNPGDLYGVSKCFGEALGRYMAEQEGLSVIALRIGAFLPVEKACAKNWFGSLDAFISPDDLQQLIERCIEVEPLRFALLHALSNNRFKRLDISDTRALVGYAPRDDSTAAHPQLKDFDLEHTISTHTVRDPQQASGLRDDL